MIKHSYSQGAVEAFAEVPKVWTTEKGLQVILTAIYQNT